MMLTGTYRGPVDRLVGESALLRHDRTIGMILAQFDNCEFSEAYGWHQFSVTDFVIDEASDGT